MTGNMLAQMQSLPCGETELRVTNKIYIYLYNL